MGEEKKPSKPIFHTLVRPVIVRSLCNISSIINENRYCILKNVIPIPNAITIFISILPLIHLSCGVLNTNKIYITIRNTPTSEVADHKMSTVANISTIRIQAKRFFFVLININKMEQHNAGNK